MRVNIQKGYIRITDIMLILDDIRIAEIPKLGDILPCGLKTTIIGKFVN